MMPDKILTDFFYMSHHAMVVINSGNNPKSSEEY